MNLTIASKRSHLTIPEGTERVYYVKYENELEWSMFWDPITGFNHQEGYEYVINVTVTPTKKPRMEDDGRVSYKLNYIISSEEKESEGIPPSWIK